MMNEMPKIKKCNVTDCAYNRENNCHAMAITVGDEACAACDTFTQFRNKGGVPNLTGMVGACKVSSCTFNTSLECAAPDIDVDWHQTHAECMTFKSK